MKSSVYVWIKTNSVMFINAGSLVGTTAVTSLLGFVYWWVAARLFPPETVGFASAAISAMMLLGSVCILGLGTLLTGELQRQKGKEVALIHAALLLVGGVGAGVGIVFALLLPLLIADFGPLSANIGNILLFACGVSFTAITLVLDQAVIGLLRGELQFWRNTLFAAIKLVALLGASLWLTHEVNMTVYTTWTIGNVLSVAMLVVWFIVKEGWPDRRCLPHWGVLRQLRTKAIQHHILNLLIQAPSLALPVFVAALLSVRANAWFYIAWMLTSFLTVPPQALSTVLYAESSAQPGVVAHKARLTLALAFGVCIVGNIVLQVGATQILEVFGHLYAQEATWTLRILSLAVFPFIIKSYYIIICRIQRRLVQAMLPLLGCAMLELGSAALGAHLGGLPGLSTGWVMALLVEAVCMFNTVYRIIRFTGETTLSEEALREQEQRQCAS